MASEKRKGGLIDGVAYSKGARADKAPAYQSYQYKNEGSFYGKARSKAASKMKKGGY